MVGMGNGGVAIPDCVVWSFVALWREWWGFGVLGGVNGVLL